MTRGGVLVLLNLDASAVPAARGQLLQAVFGAAWREGRGSDCWKVVGTFLSENCSDFAGRD